MQKTTVGLVFFIVFLFALTLTACSGSDTGNSGNSIDSNDELPDPQLSPSALPLAAPLGVVNDVGPGDCSPLSASSCRTLSVRCPAMEPLTVVVAILNPAREAKATIIAHPAGGGTQFAGGGMILERYLELDYRVVNLKWSAEWELIQDGVESIKAAACRPASLFKWVFDNVHGGRRDFAFCGQGHSGGSAAISYGLTTYGMEDYFDYVLLTQGPPMGRLDCGCNPSGPLCTPPPLCPELVTPSVPLPSAAINRWEGITTCGSPEISDTDLALLFADSVSSDDGDFRYPKTQMSGWYCTQEPNGTTGGGAFYLRRVSPRPRIFCSPNCREEDIFNPTAALSDGTLVSDALVEEMVERCIPRHN